MALLSNHRGHSAFYELDHVLMGVGALLFLSGSVEGLYAIAAGVGLHMLRG